MIKKTFFCSLSLFFFITVKAQNQGNIWCFGDSAILNFNSGSITIDTCGMRSLETSVSIADSSGNLIFYAHNTNGAINCSGGGLTDRGIIFNKFHQMVVNGDSIYCSSDYNDMIIIPDPAIATEYYLFCSRTGWSFINSGLFSNKYSSTVNSGQGGLLYKNMIVDTVPTIRTLAATKHANGTDWWMVSKECNCMGYTALNTFHIYAINSSGISKINQNIGPINYTHSSFAFSSDGEKLLEVNVMGLIALYDFDRCTGQLSNPIIIQNETLNPGPTDYYRACEFSSNSRYIYVFNNSSSTYNVFQFDLASTNISASKTSVYSSVYPNRLGILKRAPDNKIYVTSAYGYCFPYPDSIYNQYNMNLTVIESPDSGGLACNVQPFSFFLGGKRTYFGLPNNPDYTLGALPNQCPVGITEQTLLNNSVSVSPNPAASNVKIESSYFIKKIKLVSVTGALVFVKEVSATKINLETENYSEGIYSLIIETEKGVVIKKLVVM